MKRILCFVGVIAALFALVIVPVNAAVSTQNNVTITDWVVPSGVSDTESIFACSNTYVRVTSKYSDEQYEYANIGVKVYVLYDLMIDLYIDDVWQTNALSPLNDYNVQFIYSSADVTAYNYPPASDLGFTFNGYTLGGYTQEDLDNARQEGYEQGLEEGNQAAYDEGYANGVVAGRDQLFDQATASQVNAFNPISGVTLEVYSIQEDNSRNFTINVPIYLTDLGLVDFSRIYSYILNWFSSNNPNTEWRPLSLSFTFVWSNEADVSLSYRLNPVIQNYFRVIGSVDSSNLDIKFAIQGQSYQIESFVPAINGNVAYYDVSQYKDTRFVSVNLTWQVYGGTPPDYFDFLNYMYLETDALCPNQNFVYGYVYGVEVTEKNKQELINQAFDEGVLQGKSEKQQASYDLGFSEGRLEGLSLADNGSFVKMISAVVEAPINGVLSMIDFDILGFNMRVAFGSLIGLCLVIIVIKKVI